MQNFDSRFELSHGGTKRDIIWCRNGTINKRHIIRAKWQIIGSTLQNNYTVKYLILWKNGGSYMGWEFFGVSIDTKISQTSGTVGAFSTASLII